jgi:hypothetical protein
VEDPEADLPGRGREAILEDRQGPEGVLRRRVLEELRRDDGEGLAAPSAKSGTEMAGDPTPAPVAATTMS